MKTTGSIGCSDGSEQPISFASKTLSKPERNYS